ncbi:MAG: CHASE3 domain-containing protein [Nitrososphaeraceae archaeon]
MLSNKLLLVAIALPLITLLIIGTQTYKNIISFQQQTKFIEKTHQVITALQNLLTLITDADTGQRGFVITGNETYLKPYDISLNNLTFTISRIHKLISNDDKHSDLLRNINLNVYPLLQNKISDLEKAIDTRKNRGFNASAEDMSADDGENLMDQIRKNIISIINEEEKILQSNTNKSIIDGQNLLYIYIVGILISIVITTITIIVTYSQLNIKHRHITKLLEIEIYKKTLELQQSNKFLKKLNDELKRNDDMQKEFINIAAHELRTPVQSIVGYIEMVKNFPENFKKYLEPLERNSQRLYQLTEDILDIAKIESDNLKLSKEKFDICQLVKELTYEFDSRIKREKENEFFISLEKNNQTDHSGKILVYADRYRIQQVISNLLNNAHKFTENGKIIVKIKKTENDNKQVKISVHDEGKGIDKEILSRLYEKFATKSRTGTGLGLYISKNIVESHRGTIRGYNNKYGKGATFEFTLPLAKTE